MISSKFCTTLDYDSMLSFNSVADLHSNILDSRPSSNFLQVDAPPWEILDPPLFMDGTFQIHIVLLYGVLCFLFSVKLSIHMRRRPRPSTYYSMYHDNRGPQAQTETDGTLLLCEYSPIKVHTCTFSLRKNLCTVRISTRSNRKSAKQLIENHATTTTHT